MAAWDSDWARRLLPPVEEVAEHTKLWWAAAAGITAMGVAELLSNGVAKQLVERRRPPEEWIPHEDVEDRPDSSSFPSGHTAAAVAFTAALAPCWPWAGAACAVPTLAVAIERVHSGAHYPSDVAAGAAIGLTAAALVRATPRLLIRAPGDDPARRRVTGCSRGTRAVTAAWTFQPGSGFPWRLVLRSGTSRPRAITSY
ncbi:phosphatase PAP2 family protein [Streptomyces xanthophaeus]